MRSRPCTQVQQATKEREQRLAAAANNATTAVEPEPEIVREYNYEDYKKQLKAMEAEKGALSAWGMARPMREAVGKYGGDLSGQLEGGGGRRASPEHLWDAPQPQAALAWLCFP